MRKIMASVNLTLNGYMAGIDGELNWHFPYWDEAMSAYSYEQLRVADTLLLGRRTYELMADYWPHAATRPSPSEADMVLADNMNSYRKIVFSGSLAHARWQNTIIVNKITRQYFHTLKQQAGKNMLILGSGSIIHKLTQLGLIDEYCLWIHPVILPAGVPLFKKIKIPPHLQLLTTREFSTGVVVLNYTSNTIKTQTTQ